MNESPPPSPRAGVAAAAVLALTAVAVALLLVATRPQPVQIMILPPVPSGTPAPTDTPAPIAVYVTGAVAQSERLHQLPAGSRVEDALAAAGGLLTDADRSRINLAARLRDGDHIHVHTLSAVEVMLPTDSAGGLVAVNSATLEELQALPAIGPVTAQNIIDHRETHGRFADLSALDAVSGIGPATLAQLADLVTFD